MKYFIVACFAFSLGLIPIELKAQNEPTSVNQNSWTQSGTAIWSGDAGLTYRSVYNPVENSNRNQLEMRLTPGYSRFVYEKLAIGLRTQITMLIEKGSAIGLAGFGVEPNIRYYPVTWNSFLPYLEVNAMAGQDLSLESSFGAERNSGLMFRTGYRLGVTHMLSDNLGLFVDGGHVMEYGDSFDHQDTAFTTRFGFVLYRF